MIALASAWPQPQAARYPAPGKVVAPKSSPTDVAAWIVFAIGGGLIALAWGASLRARPLQMRKRRTSTA